MKSLVFLLLSVTVSAWAPSARLVRPKSLLAAAASQQQAAAVQPTTKAAQTMEKNNYVQPTSQKATQTMEKNNDSIPFSIPAPTVPSSAPRVVHSSQMVDKEKVEYLDGTFTYCCDKHLQNPPK